MGEVLDFHLTPERKSELEAELMEVENRADEIIRILGRGAIVAEPLPEWQA